MTTITMSTRQIAATDLVGTDMILVDGTVWAIAEMLTRPRLGRVLVAGITRHGDERIFRFLFDQEVTVCDFT